MTTGVFDCSLRHTEYPVMAFAGFPVLGSLGFTHIAGKPLPLSSKPESLGNHHSSMRDFDVYRRDVLFPAHLVLLVFSSGHWAHSSVLFLAIFSSVSKAPYGKHVNVPAFYPVCNKKMEKKNVHVAIRRH